MRVYLKLNTGIHTRLMSVPDEIVMQGMEYKLPLQTSMSVHVINLAQEAVKEMTSIPVLVFRNSGKRYNGIVVMELVRVENI